MDCHVSYSTLPDMLVFKQTRSQTSKRPLQIGKGQREPTRTMEVSGRLTAKHRRQRFAALLPKNFAPKGLARDGGRCPIGGLAAQSFVTLDHFP